jgi:hypothetical protein
LVLRQFSQDIPSSFLPFSTDSIKAIHLGGLFLLIPLCADFIEAIPSSFKTLSAILTINVPLILKVREIIYFLRANISWGISRDFSRRKRPF